MGYRRVPFAVDEWYHCFSRGVDKRITFEDAQDFNRFEQLLYLANDTKPIDRNFFPNTAHDDIFSRPREAPLVAVGAYCLMRNHFHLLLQEITDGGITRFMRKLGTGYTMYFNMKNERIGNLFVKPFRSKHIAEDVYLRHVAHYIHLNPAEIFEHGWKQGSVVNIKSLEQDLLDYPHSSFPDYYGVRRPARTILDTAARDLLNDGMPRSKTLLMEAATYYRELKY